MKSTWWLTAVMLATSMFSFYRPAQAAEEIIELRLQRAKCLCGVVSIFGDSPLKHAKVEEFSPDWKQVFRSIDTDDEGRFTLAPIKGRKIYYLQISSRQTGVNPLRIPVELSHFRGAKLLQLKLRLA